MREYQIQQYTGRQYGWEEVCSETTRKEAQERRKEYQENQPEYSVRIVCKTITEIIDE
jgi:hypothetical protein